jgi:RHS repeat-associated protein
MTWNTKNSSFKTSNAASGDNQPLALAADNLLTNLPIGEPTALLSYDIASTKALVFAHAIGSDLYVEARDLSGNTIFSQSTPYNGFAIELIVHCEVSGWLAVAVGAGELYVFDSTTGAFIDSITLPVKDVYETATGEVIVRTTYSTAPYTRFEEVTESMGTLSSTLKWSYNANSVGCYDQTSNTIPLGVQETGQVRFNAYDLVTGNLKWTQTFSDSTEPKTRAYDDSGNLLCSFLKNDPGSEGRLSMLAKLDGATGNVVWESDLTSYERNALASFLFDGFSYLQDKCFGPTGDLQPWGAKRITSEYPKPGPDGPLTSLDLIGNDDNDTDLLQLAVCNDAIYVHHVGVELLADCQGFQHSKHVMVLDPSDGHILKRIELGKGGSLYGAGGLFAANHSGGSWAIVSSDPNSEHSLSIVGMDIDKISFGVSYTNRFGTDLPMDFDYFNRGCFADGKFYFPYEDSSGNRDLNFMGDLYVDDRDDRNCRKSDCPEKDTVDGMINTFGQPSLNLGSMLSDVGMWFKGCIFGELPLSPGYGWKLDSYQYVEEKPNGDLVYFDGTGMFERWFQVDGDFFSAHSDNYRKAVKNPDGTYSITERNGMVKNFDSQNRLSTVVDLNGNTQTLTYETSGDERLLKIDDGRGRESNFGYAGRTDGQPVTITSHTPSIGSARVTTFEYYPTGHASEDRLKKITDPENETMEIVYHADGRLHQIKDTRNVIAMELTYHPDGRTHTVKSYDQTLSTTTYDDINCEITVSTQDLTDPLAPLRENVVLYEKEYRNILERRQKVDDTTWNVTKNFYESPSSPYLLTKVIAPNGAVTNYSYTASGNLRETEDAQGYITTITYNEQSNPGHPNPDLTTRVERPLLEATVERPTTNYVYDIKGNLIEIIDAKSESVRLTYTADGMVETIEDRMGNTSVLTYQGVPFDGSFRHMQKIEIPTDALGGVRASDYVFDDFDNLLSVSNDLSETMTMTYDNLDRIRTVTDPNSNITESSYQSGLLEHVLLPANQASGINKRQVTPIYDSTGRTTELKRHIDVSTELSRVKYQYTGFSELKVLGRSLSGTDREFEFSYDRLGRLKEAVDPLGRMSQKGYEPFCVGSASTSARGVRTKSDFDTRCLLTQVTTGDPGVDELTVVNPRDTRTFHYDELGRLVKTTQPSANLQADSIYGGAQYGVSVYGQSSTTLDGQRLYEYDILDRLTKLTLENGQSFSYGHDANGNVKSVTDPDLKVTEYSYRPDQLLEQVRIKRDLESDRDFDYIYDVVGRLKEVHYPSPTGIKLFIDDGSGGSGWDSAGRLKHLRYEKGGSPLRSFSYEYDPSGNRTQTTEVSGGNTIVWQYEYDWLDRLLKVKKGTTTSNTADTAIYTYDSLDNATKLELPVDLLEYDFGFDDASNIIERKETNTQPPTPVVNFIEAFTSDDDGNVLTRTRNDTNLKITYEWDDFNKLMAVSSAISGVTTSDKKQKNHYGVNGFRRHKVSKSGEATTEYAEGLTAAVTKSQFKSRRYIRGHQLLGFEEEDGSFYYFLTDALGSVRDIVRGTDGTVVQQYEFDERGNHLISPMSGGPSSPKSFVGGLSVNDDTADSGLYLMGHRHYDPSLGRFLSRDPIGFSGGLSLFSYANNSPSSRVDPTGLQPGPHLYDPTDPMNLEVYNPDPGPVEAAVGEMMLSEIPPIGAGLAIRDYRESPGFWTGAAVLASLAGLGALRVLRNLGSASRFGRAGRAGQRGAMNLGGGPCDGHEFGDFGDYVIPKNRNVRISKRTLKPDVFAEGVIGTLRTKFRGIDIVSSLVERFPSSASFPEFWKKMKSPLKGFKNTEELHWFEHPMVDKWFDVKIKERGN